MELGLATFADLASGVSPEQRMRDLLEEAELADLLGLDVFAVGEHHRPDFLVSSPAVVRAGALGLPLTVAIIGGQPERFVPLVDLYRQAFEAAGHDPADARVAINTHAFVGETSEAADRAFAASYLAMMNRIGRERGWPPSGRPEYDALRSPRGALAAGSPTQVAEKILFEHELFGHQRYVGQMSVGAVAHADVMRSIELFGTEVATVVRAEIERREASSSAATQAA
jgi:alkanesulfonate monooxygenase SsuD/methylene tetrahydromethanopterin reductase-like flavin-dependent oxidoreductase (luciferase family)